MTQVSLGATENVVKTSDLDQATINHMTHSSTSPPPFLSPDFKTHFETYRKVAFCFSPLAFIYSTEDAFSRNYYLQHPSPYLVLLVGVLKVKATVYISRHQKQHPNPRIATLSITQAD